MAIYVVCQNGDCAIPQPVEKYQSLTEEESKNVDCPICGAILIDYKGSGDLSGRSHPTKYIENDSPERKRAKKIHRKRKKFTAEIQAMEDESLQKWKLERG